MLFRSHSLHLFGHSQVWILSGPRVLSFLTWLMRVSWTPAQGIYWDIVKTLEWIMCRSSLISKRSTGKNNISGWGRTQLSTSYHINVMVCDGEKVHFCFTHVCFHSSHALTSDVSIEEMARAAEFFLSDGVIITGAATGLQANPEELRGTAPITQSSLYR